LVRSVRAARIGRVLRKLRTRPLRAVLLRGRVLRRPRCGPTPFASLRGRASARTPPHPARLRTAARHQPEVAGIAGPDRFARGRSVLDEKLPDQARTPM